MPPSDIDRRARSLQWPHRPRGGASSSGFRTPDGAKWVWHPGVSALLPDLDDAATLGCLLALVRRVWRPAGYLVWTEWDAEAEVWRLGWAITGGPTFGNPSVPVGDTESELLIVALEAAPARP